MTNEAKKFSPPPFMVVGPDGKLTPAPAPVNRPPPLPPIAEATGKKTVSPERLAALNANRAKFGQPPLDPDGNHPSPITDPRADLERRRASGAAQPTSKATGTEAERDPNIVARSFMMTDPKSLPMLPWVYGKYLLRGCVSLTVAPSGIGKTFELITENLAMVTGRKLLHDEPAGKLRCWFFNGEEPLDILKRRFAAAGLLHGISNEDIGDRLFVNDRMTKLVIATQGRDGLIINSPAIVAMLNEIREKRIDVITIDPLISAHAVSENDNSAIDQVIKLYADIAQEMNIAISIAHHTRKVQAGAGVGIEDARGASSMVGAVRSARTMNEMSVKEALEAGFDNRHRYIRIDDAKPNHAPRAERADWVRIESVYLGNGPEGIAGSAGDSIGAVKPWHWPDAMQGITPDKLELVMAAVTAGGPYRKSSLAAAWVGKPIARALELNLGDKAQKAQVARLIKSLIGSGALTVVEGKDENSIDREFVEIGKARKTGLTGA